MALVTTVCRELSPDVHHGPRRRHKIRLADVMTLFFSENHTANELRQFFIRCPALHLRVQIVVPDREQAGANLAIGGDADAAAVAAERMRDRSDDPNLANAVIEAVTPRG